jgi:serine protease Do
MSIAIGGAGGSYLGVRIEDVDGARAEEVGLSGEYGVYVTSVVEEGPAADAGLREGDVIVRWNGDRIESVAQLQRRMGETPAGRTVSLGVLRDRADREFAIALGDRADQYGEAHVFTVPRGRVAIDRADASEIRQRVVEGLARPRVRSVTPRDGQAMGLFMGRPRLGVSIQSLGDQLAEYFDVDGGALVTAVTEDSPAEAAGIRAGDVITGIGGESVADPGDLLEALSELEAGAVEVTVMREGQRRSFTVELEEAERSGQSSLRFFGRDGDEVSIDPISWEGFQMDEMDFSFDLDGETIDLVIPRIEIPEIAIPGFNFRLPRIDVII